MIQHMRDMHDGLGSTLISAIRSVDGGGMSDEKVSQIIKDCKDDLKLVIDSMEPGPKPICCCFWRQWGFGRSPSGRYGV